MRTIRRLLFGATRPEKEATLSVVVPEGAGPDAQSERASLVLDSARAAIDQEFHIAERLDAKARNQVAVGGAWYALVQAAASLAIKEGIDAGADSLLFSAVVVLAVASGVALAISIGFSYGVWKLRDEEEITHASLEEMAAAARDPSVDLVGQFVQHYGWILWTRRENNKKRWTNFGRSVPPWALALVLGLAELVAAVALLAQS